MTGGVTGAGGAIHDFESLIKSYAADIDDFFFIQIGANDGLIGDPIAPHVRDFGWHGVLVEPQPQVFEQRLLPNYADCEGLVFENAAISDSDGWRDLFVISCSTDRWATGLASFERTHLELHFENGYVQRCLGDVPAPSVDEGIATTSVETMTFATLLDTHGPERLHLLQVDVEGYDYELLKLYDFDRLAPSIVQFECHVMTPDQLLSSRQLMAQAGYFTFLDAINVVCVQQSVVQQLGLSFDLAAWQDAREPVLQVVEPGASDRRVGGRESVRRLVVEIFKRLNQLIDKLLRRSRSLFR